MKSLCHVHFLLFCDLFVALKEIVHILIVAIVFTTKKVVSESDVNFFVLLGAYILELVVEVLGLDHVVRLERGWSCRNFSLFLLSFLDRLLLDQEFLLLLDLLFVFL